MNKLKLITIPLILLLSCDENHDKQLKENIEQLRVEFQGKYEILSSYSVDPVDLNMDGVTSTNLINENPEISKAELEIRIQDQSEHLFEEKWPVETIVVPRGEVFDSTSFQSNYSIYYALYVNHSICQFIDENETIRLLSDPEQNSTNTLISFESIHSEENEFITVVTIRKLYTMNGWITIKIESVYKRYTTNT